MFRRTVSGIMLTLLLISVFYFAVHILPVLYAQQTTGAQILISPERVDVPLGESFTITVNLTNAEKLYTWQVVLKYNGTVINCTEADVWIPEDNVFSGHTMNPTVPAFGKDAVDGLDYMMWACSLQGDDYVSVTEGVLFKANFTIKNVGSTIIEIATKDKPVRVGQFYKHYSFFLDYDLEEHPLSLEKPCMVTVETHAWTGTVYIRADGSIDPPDAPIQKDGNLYTFTADIYGSIVVERDNIIIDGASRTLQGTGSEKGIDLSGRTNVTLKNAQIKNFRDGVCLAHSSNNIISGNNITINSDVGIGVGIGYSNYNSIIGNNITNNIAALGVYLFNSSHNNIIGNIITNNSRAGVALESYSNYNSIIGNNITNNSREGVYLARSSNNIISGNNITNNEYGVLLYSSSNNIISGNNITNNDYRVLLRYSSSNWFYYNNFIDNGVQVYSYESINVWDDGYPSGGNYWSDYSGIDLYSGSYQNIIGSDGIGDTPYVIDANNTDRYPLMAPFKAFYAGIWNGTKYFVNIISNSTVSSFAFDPSKGPYLKFNVTGDDGTIGFCRVTIPKSLLWAEDGWTITVDDQQIKDYSEAEDENNTYLYFTYHHSTQTIVIQGTNVIPEFPSNTVLLGILMLITIPLIIAKKKRFKKRIANHSPLLLLPTRRRARNCIQSP